VAGTGAAPGGSALRIVRGGVNTGLKWGSNRGGVASPSSGGHLLKAEGVLHATADHGVAWGGTGGDWGAEAEVPVLGGGCNGVRVRVS